jgi:DNA-binding IclR family transcriptional regulator
MCSPVRANQIANALKLPPVSVLRRLQELVKDGYVERVGNTYRVTDKVNIPDLQKKLQRRIDLVTHTAKKLYELSAVTGPAKCSQGVNYCVKNTETVASARALS